MTCAVAPEWYLGVLSEHLVPIVERACAGTEYSYVANVTADRWAQGNLREVFFRCEANTPDDLKEVSFVLRPSTNPDYLNVELRCGTPVLGAMPRASPFCPMGASR